MWQSFARSRSRCVRCAFFLCTNLTNKPLARIGVVVDTAPRRVEVCASAPRPFIGGTFIVE